MLRWILLLLVLGGLYWFYERDYETFTATHPPNPERFSKDPPLSGRPGGGLNPFVTDTDIDAPPQHPHAP